MKENQGGSARQVLLFSLPVIISQGCDGLMMITDRYLISLFDPLGPPGAMAGALSAFTLWVFTTGLLGYITPIVSRLAGSGDHVGKEQVLFQGVLVSIVSALVLSFAGPTLARLNYEVLGVPAEVVAIAMRYLNVLMAATIIVHLKNAFAAYFAGIGQTRTVMWISVVGILFNIPTTYFAIRGDFGDGWAGIEGAAFGTILAELLMVLLYLYVYAQVRGFHRQDWKINPDLLSSLLRFGSSAGAEYLVMTLAANTFVAAFQSYSIEASKAVTIAISYSWTLVLPFVGLNIGLSSLIGFSLGEKNLELAKTTVRSGLKITLSATAAATLIFWVFPDSLATVFDTKPGPENSLAISMIIALPALLLCDAISFVLTAALRAGGDTRFCFLMSWVVQWSQVAICLMGIYWLGWAPLTVWWLFIAAIAVQSGFHIWRYLGGRWTTIAL